MALDEVFFQAWKRKHDNPAAPAIASASRTVYPKSLEDLIAICANRAPGEGLHAAGSHWALSTAALSDMTFIETHDPNNIHQAMGKTLYDVVPNCLSDAFLTALASRHVKPFDAATVSENEGLYPIHIETGKRVFQLYAELDTGDTDSRSLANLIASKFGNSDYLGPWAFRTLGGAGGQTVFGALHTGTHGGDIHMGPICDSVMAMHLVADGGQHYWIEPASFHLGIEAPLTDDKKLNDFYGQSRFANPKGASPNFHVIRNDDIFNSVLISAGRFGAVYSIVLAAVRQYTLHQERRLTTWESIRGDVNNLSSALYAHMDGPSFAPNKFLQIAVSVTPHANFSLHHAGVTKRRNVPMAVVPNTSVPAGRPERVGFVTVPFDPLIQGPRFLFAGASHTYEPDPNNPGAAKPANFLENACSDANFIIGVLKGIIKELEDFFSSGTVGVVLGTVALAGGGGILALAGAVLAFLAALAALLGLLESQKDSRFGQVMNDLRGLLLDDPDPAKREAGLLVWQMIASGVFTDNQKNADYEAISYAVMDGFDYFDQSCNVNVQSIEVFFDATDPKLIDFIDKLLAFEIAQEVSQGRAFVGYISMRFTGPTRALLGPQKFPMNCAVEVAGLADVSGTKELIDFAITVALNGNFNGILHWGQRNESTRAHIQERFGDPLVDPHCPMARWRAALNGITKKGKLNGFSSAFTRQTGLEEV